MDSIFLKVKKGLEFLLVTIFIILVVDVVWQVIARYAQISSGFTEELSRFLLIWLTALATAYSRSYKGQMAIDFLFNKCQPKTQFYLSLFIEIIIAVFALVVMIIGGINLVYITLKLGQFSPSLNLPMGVVYSIVPVSGLLIVFFSLHHLKSYFSISTTQKI